MRAVIIIISCIALTGIMFKGCQSSKSVSSDNLANQADSIQSEKDSISYVLGKNMYQNFKQRDVEIDEKLMAKGLLDAAEGSDSLISDEQARPLMMKFQREMQQKMRKQRQGGQQGAPQQNRKQRMKEKLKERMQKKQQQQQSQPEQPDDNDQ